MMVFSLEIENKKYFVSIENFKKGIQKDAHLILASFIKQRENKSE